MESENTQPRELTSDELVLVTGGCDSLPPGFNIDVTFNNTEPNQGTQIAFIFQP